jgi:hypothetical protein
VSICVSFIHAGTSATSGQEARSCTVYTSSSNYFLLVPHSIFNLGLR